MVISTNFLVSYSFFRQGPLLNWLLAIVNKTYHKNKEQITRELEQIRKAQEDPQEFAPIYHQYYQEIFVYINRRVDDLDLVADITSRTFTRCLTNLHKFKFMGVPFSSWLYKIAINEVRQFFRARKNYPRMVSLTDADFALIAEETVAEPTTLEKAHKILPELLGNLSETELQYLELRFFEQKSFREIGFMMGLSEVNAKVKTYRILKKLKRLAARNNQ